MSTGFDLTVHKRDSKGKVMVTDPYRLEINQGVKRYERPVGSGIFYHEDGRLTDEGKVKLKELEEKEAKAAQAKADAEAAAKQELQDLRDKAAAYDKLMAEQKKAK